MRADHEKPTPEPTPSESQGNPAPEQPLPPDETVVVEKGASDGGTETR